MTTFTHPLLKALLGSGVRVARTLGTLTMLLGANAWTAEVWAADEPPQFPDQKLSTCIDKALNKAGIDSATDLTSLTCNAMGIADASGINGLINLKRLSLFGNRLKVINLDGLMALETLNLANNALTGIDLSSAPALTTLYLFGNRLEELNLETQELLVKLKAEKNQLLAVQFANPSALQKVYLFNNEMVDIVIDTLPALKFIDVRSNPMPDEVYDYLDEFRGVKASHDGNTEDWK